MLELTHTLVDLEECERHRTTPCDIIERGRGDVWLVSINAIRLDREPQWAIHKTESHVYVPLLPYLTKDSPELTTAFFFGLGVRAALLLHQPVRRLHIAIGTPVYLVESPGEEPRLRTFIGFAALLGN